MAEKINLSPEAPDSLYTGALKINAAIDELALKLDKTLGGTLQGPLTLVSDPVEDFQAATRRYVDSMVLKLNLKESVKAATDVPVILNDEQIIDGINVTTDDRVLVKNQTNAAENGIYIVQNTAWIRASDANTETKVRSGMCVFVEQGVVNSSSGWILSAEEPITLETTPLTFVKFSIDTETIDDLQFKAGEFDTHKSKSALINDPGHVEHGAFTATLNVGWSGSSAPFTQLLNVSGILSTDTPIIDVVMDGDFETDKARQEAWSYIYRAVTENDSITFFATEKPTVELPIQIKVVR
jgi:hypothetical protein